MNHLSQQSYQRWILFNVYCPECPPGGGGGGGGGVQLYTGVDSKKRFLPFSHRRELVAFNGTGL